MGRARDHVDGDTGIHLKATTLATILAPLIVVATAAPAFGQANNDSLGARLFTGYSFSSEGSMTMHGFHASLASEVHERVAVLMDFSGHYTSGPAVSDFLDEVDFAAPDNADFGFYAYRFGPQIKLFEGEKVTTFVHLLFGGHYIHAFSPDGSNGIHGFAGGAGGGADWNVSENIAIRIPQFDYSFKRVAGTTLSGFRVSTGLVFRFR